MFVAGVVGAAGVQMRLCEFVVGGVVGGRFLDRGCGGGGGVKSSGS